MFVSGESIYNLVPPSRPVAKGSAVDQLVRSPTQAMQRAAAGAPPSYSTLGLLNSTKVVANASGAEKDIDEQAGGVHPIRATSRTIGRVVKREVDTQEFLRRGTGAPACDSTARLAASQQRLRRMDGSPGSGGDMAVEYDEEGNECEGGGFDATGAPLPASYRSGRSLGLSGESRTLGRSFSRPRVADPKPGVPDARDVPLCGLKSDKNYVLSNAVEAVQQPTRHKQPVQSRAVDRATYGKVPAYLEKVKDDVARERAAASGGDAAASAGAGGTGAGGASAGGPGGLDVMGEEERKQLLAELKQKWTDRNKQYQQLSFRLDTRSKVLRKEYLERELERIEAFISKLSKGKVIVKP